MRLLIEALITRCPGTVVETIVGSLTSGARCYSAQVVPLTHCRGIGHAMSGTSLPEAVRLAAAKALGIDTTPVYDESGFTSGAGLGGGGAA